MKLLKRINRLGSRGVKRVRAWRARHATAIPWLMVYDGGVLAALQTFVPPDAVRVALRIDGGPERILPVASVNIVDGTPVAFAYMDTGLIDGALVCRLTVSALNRSRTEIIALGRGRFAGRIVGLRNYALEGWVAPLFAVTDTAEPTVSLIVDGIAGEPVRLDRFRHELMLSGSQGGWNGFLLPLPVAALDGLPHTLAVRAGETLIDAGSFAANPMFKIDGARTDLLFGWYFDTSLDDVPTQMRIVRDGVTKFEVLTHARSDIHAAFGRDFGSFVFRDVKIEPGSLLVAGADETGLIVCRFGDEMIARRDSRALLLGANTLTESLDARRTIRDTLVQTARKTPLADLAFEPLIGAADSAGTPRIRALKAPPACAIVPVYNGLSDLAVFVASLIPQLVPGRLRAILIDDASPDPAIGRYLAYLASQNHDGLTVLVNESNFGFVATINRGLALLMEGEDPILVNADTILPLGALDRLGRHCHAQPGIASVTPMSNNATILSFPNTTVANAPAFGLDVTALDQAFADEGALPVVIPTGVGFCLYLNRLALDEVGPLSPEWGRGYCEEVDWCLTARDLGWMHLVATDTFVIHEGSVSFGVSERVAILKINHARLEALYPEYSKEIDTFVLADPLSDLRISVFLRLIVGRFSDLTVHITHGIGGGTDRYVHDLLHLSRAPEHWVAILSPVAAAGTDKRLSFVLDRMGTTLTVAPEQVERLFAGIEAAGIRIQLHVNSRLIYDSSFLRSLLSGTRPYIVMLHDFQWYCPRVHLIDERSFYCGEPPPEICQHCVNRTDIYNFADQNTLIARDIDGWLAFNTKILRNATRLIAPSQDTANRYARRFDFTDIVVLPHPETGGTHRFRSIGRRAAVSGSLHVAIVGAIGRHKGFDLLVRLVERAARDRIPFFLTVIGYTCDDASLLLHGNAAVTGSYAPSELKARLDAADPDYVFLPSVWPETYSYVLSEVWEAGYSVVAFDFGAQAERIRAAGGGILIPPTRDTRALLASLVAARHEIERTRAPFPVRSTVTSLEAYYDQI